MLSRSRPKRAAISPRALLSAGVGMGLLALLIGGCEQNGSAGGAAAIDSPYLLAAEPEGAVSIADAKKQLGEKPDVVIMGRIGAKDFDPWIKGEAAFLVEEALPAALGHDHGPGHDADDCPFCKRRRKSKDFVATIRVCGEDGTALKTDAQKLLGVKKGDLVLIKGRGEIGDLETLVVHASGIHIKR